jgi:iron complex outermembrane receptor protein
MHLQSRDLVRKEANIIIIMLWIAPGDTALSCNYYRYRIMMYKNSFTVRKTAIAAALAMTTAPALAQLVLEEVIVTAQKRVESVQDISATVNVVSGDDINRFQAFDFNSLADQTAGLTLASPNARNSLISMRGVSVDPESGASAAVDPYWNDAVVRPDVAFTPMYDLQRVEVLRGPQGTLQGRTSPGGAINIITQRADLDVSSGYIQGSAADNEGINSQFAYGMPLIEGKLGVRIAGVYETNNGADVENITTGFDDEENETKSARLSTVWQVTDTFNAELIYQWLDNDTDDPKAMTGNDALGVRPTLKPDDNKALAPTDNQASLNIDALANLILNWEVMDHEVTGIVAYQDTSKDYWEENDRANTVQSLDPQPTEAPTYQTSTTDTESTSYELRVASMDNDFWDYMVGLYYKDQNTDTVFDRNSVRFDVAGTGFATQTVIPVYANDFAIFTFNTFYLSQNLQLEAGLRWTDYDNFRRADVFYTGLTYVPPPLAPFEDQIDAGFAEAFPLNAIPDSETDPQDDAWTGSLKLRWDWTDEVSLYGSYNRGYRNGGMSISPGPTFELVGLDNLLYDKEESDAFELGFKSRLLDGRATLNGAVYYQTFDGYQGFVRGIQVLDDQGIPQDVPGGLVFNGDANIWGVEFEGRILLTETWNAGGALSYSKGEWDGAKKPCNERETGESLGFCDIDGDALGGEPEWSMSLNSEYYFPLESTEIYLRGLFKYTDDRINTDASAGLGNTTDEFESYQTLDLFVGWRSNEFTWDVSVWAKNVTDEDEVVFQRGPDAIDVEFSEGSYTQTNILKERIVGMTARYNF